MPEWIAELARTFWIAFAAAAILAAPIYKTLLRLKSRQTVSQYAPEGHQKKQGTPTMGGLILVAGALVALAVAGPVFPLVWPAAILLLGFAAIGFVDDFVVPRLIAGKRGLGWKQKIVMQLVLAALACVWARGGVDWESSVLVFLVLFFSNAYNFSDGLDGLAGSLLLGLAVGLVGIGLLIGTPVAIMIPIAALVGGVIPFLFLNAPPARIFMGDVGSLPVGAVLGYVVGAMALPPVGNALNAPAYTLAANRSVSGGGSPLLALVVLSVMMIVELVPVPLQILSVKLRKKRLFPYTPIHHAFEKAGWPESRVVWHFALAQLLLSLLALALISDFSPRPGSESVYKAARR